MWGYNKVTCDYSKSNEETKIKRVLCYNLLKWKTYRKRWIKHQTLVKVWLTYRNIQKIKKQEYEV